MAIKKTSILLLIWIGLTAAIFWMLTLLFRLAIHGGALYFSLGATIVIIGGLLVGWYMPRLWFGAHHTPTNKLLGGFSASGGGSFFLFFEGTYR